MHDVNSPALNTGATDRTQISAQVIESVSRRVASLSREILTWIEMQEAQAVHFGIFEATTRGQQVLQRFRTRTVDGQPCGDAEILHGLRFLRELEQLVLLGVNNDANDDPEGWVFRSRMGELVRLFSNLRQRFPHQQVPVAPMLVSDLVWDVRPRRYTRRSIPLDEYLTTMPAAVRTIVRDGLNRMWQATRGVSESATEDEAEENGGGQLAFSGFQTRTMSLFNDALARQATPYSIEGLVIEAGTGSGKTFAALFPMLGYVAKTRILQGLSGCKFICIYPRQPLAENQFQAIARVLFYINHELVAGELNPLPYERQIRVGILYQHAPRTYSELGRWPREEWKPGPVHDTYVAPFVKCPACSGDLLARPKEPAPKNQHLMCANNLAGKCQVTAEQLAYIRYSREDIWGVNGATPDPPDILVSVTESLNNILASSEGQALFGHTQGAGRLTIPQAVMLDEIHLQTGSKGMQIGYLMRRLIARLCENRVAREAAREGYGHPQQELNPLLVLGLSATIYEGDDFLSRLTGVPRTSTTRIAPEEALDEILLGDAEHLLFVKAEGGKPGPLSTLIQTAMLAVHGYPQPPAGEREPYRTFGFADSLDIVNRWLIDQRDTERPVRGGTPLYRLRLPGEPENSRAFAPVPALPCHVCMHRNYPNIDCVAFQMGECWWPVYRRGLNRSLLIEVTSSQSKTFNSQTDLVIATSKLEVGYDDDRLMTVLQYLAPRDLASFVQRKGRGGRQVGTRPVMVTVLSPSRPIDVFYFRNPQLLIDPSFRRLPLNPANALARQIHALYAFIDWLANRTNGQISISNLNPDAWDLILQLPRWQDALVEFQQYLGTVFQLPPDDHAILDTLLDPARGLFSVVLQELHRTIVSKATAQNGGTRRTDGENRQPWKLANLLPNRVPPNLFSDIHLPLVRIRSSENEQYDEGLDIDQALNDFLPGHCSRRYRRFTWVPIAGLHAGGMQRPNDIPVERYFSTTDFPWQDLASINWLQVPVRLRRRLGAGTALGTIYVHRPHIIQVENVYDPAPGSGDRRFDDMSRPRWSLNHETHSAALSALPPHIHKQSTSFPLRFTEVSFPGRDSVPPSARLSPDHGVGRKPLARDVGRLFSGIRFATSSDGLGIVVHRTVLGTDYALYSVQPRQQSEVVNDVAAFMDDAGQWVGLGYSGQSDGIEFELTPRWHGGQQFHLKPEREQLLRNAIFLYEAHQRVVEQVHVNGFTLSRLIEAALAYMGDDPATMAERAQLFRTRASEAMAEIDDFVDGLFQQPVTSVHQDVATLAATPGVCAAIASAFQDTFVAINERLFLTYREDVLQHTLKHGLKAAVRLLSGASEKREVTGHTRLLIDYPAAVAQNTPRPITIFEVGLEGVGMIRALYQDMQRDPESFFHLLAGLIENCETAREEGWLLALLRLPESEIEEIVRYSRAALQASGPDERQASVRVLSEMLRRVAGHPVEEWMIRSVFRTLAREFLFPRADGTSQRIPEWKIYREINLVFLQSEEQRLRRPLGLREARFRLRRALERQPDLYPTLREVVRVFQGTGESNELAEERDVGEQELDESSDPLEEGGGLQGLERRIENFVERRFLTSCRTACPSCLQDQECEIDRSSLGVALLDRHLLLDLVENWRRDEVLVVDDGASSEKLISDLRGKFHSAPDGLVRICYTYNSAGVVDQALRLVLTKGLEVDLALRQVRQVGDRPLPSGLVEVILGLA